MEGAVDEGELGRGRFCKKDMGIDEQRVGHWIGHGNHH